MDQECCHIVMFIYIMETIADSVYMTSIDKFGGVQINHFTIMKQHLSTPTKQTNKQTNLPKQQRVRVIYIYIYQ